MAQNEVTRRLDLLDSYSLVVGTIIGTGVFLKAAIMSQSVGSPSWVLLAWVAAGILSLAGALTYAELGVLFPSAGGEYVYLREAYGRLPAFLYGWQRFLVSNPGSIAAYAVGAATFASPLVNLAPIGGIKGLALFLIAIFTFINCLSVSLGGRLSSVMTLLKIGIVLFVTIGIFGWSDSGHMQHLLGGGAGKWQGASAFGAAMLAALWAYDGWNNLPMVAGEIQKPARNIPFALGFGLLTILLLYMGVHVAYFYALPFSEVLTSNSSAHPDALPVATRAAVTFLGGKGYWILGFAFFFSAVGAMHGSILTCARVPYAMSRDGLFLKSLGYHHKKTEVPIPSLVVQWLIASALALMGNFDQLTDYVVFASWIFYALCSYAVIIFRKKLPKAKRSYRTFGYPWVPLIFVASSVFLLLNTLYTSPQQSFIGLLIIGVGIPVYFLLKKFKKAR